MLVILATALLVATAACATGAVLAAQWLTVHRATIAVTVRRAAYRTVTVRWPRRVRRLAGLVRARVRERVRPGGMFGMRLTAGLLAVTALGALFGALLEDVTAGEGIAVIDHPVARFVAAHRASGLTAVMKAVSWVGSPLGVAAFALVCGGVVSVMRRRWAALVVVAAGTGGIAVINAVLKVLIGRSRPPVAQAVDAAAGYAFPSGHAASATATLAVLAYVSVRRLRGTVARCAIWAAFAVGAVLVSMSRVYLGVHWLSDVVGGMLLGALWATVVVTAWSTHPWSTHHDRAEQRGVERAQAARAP